MLRRLACTRWPFVITMDRLAMHSGSAGDKHQKVYADCNSCDHDNIASWAVHMKNHASNFVSLRLTMFLMSQDRRSVGIRSCRVSCDHVGIRDCHTHVLENHRDGKAPDDKIRHVHIDNLLFLYRLLSTAFKRFGHRWRPARSTYVCTGARSCYGTH